MSGGCRGEIGARPPRLSFSPPEALTVGKLMVSGRITSGITRKTVFITFRLGLSTPDSAPSCQRGGGDT